MNIRVWDIALKEKEEEKQDFKPMLGRYKPNCSRGISWMYKKM